MEEIKANEAKYLHSVAKSILQINQTNRTHQHHGTTLHTYTNLGLALIGGSLLHRLLANEDASSFASTFNVIATRDDDLVAFHNISTARLPTKHTHGVGR